MKKFNTIIIFLMMIPFIAMADSGRRIPFEKIPPKAKTFINTYFGQNKILQVTAEWNEYEVLFTDMSNVEFDKLGTWKQINCKNGGIIPKDIIPIDILSYVKETFPNQIIVNIERTRWGYEVEIHNGIELEFDKKCKFIRIDN